MTRSLARACTFRVYCCQLNWTGRTGQQNARACVGRGRTRGVFLLKWLEAQQGIPREGGPARFAMHGLLGLRHPVHPLDRPGCELAHAAARLRTPLWAAAPSPCRRAAGPVSGRHSRTACRSHGLAARLKCQAIPSGCRCGRRSTEQASRMPGHRPISRRVQRRPTGAPGKVGSSDVESSRATGGFGAELLQKIVAKAAIGAGRAGAGRGGAFRHEGDCGLGRGTCGSNLARRTQKKAFTLRTLASCVKRRCTRAW
jgi:hypothetical protein